MTTITNDDDDFMIIDGKPVLKDGRRYIVPAFLRDAARADNAQHRPGPGFATDAANEQREAAFKDYLTRIGDAWRNPDRDAAPIVPNAAHPTGDACTAALADYDAWLRDAWRGGAA